MLQNMGGGMPGDFGAGTAVSLCLKLKEEFNYCLYIKCLMLQ